MTNEEVAKALTELKDAVAPADPFYKTPVGIMAMAVFGFLAVFAFDELREAPSELAEVVSDLDTTVNKLNTTVSNLEVSDSARGKEMIQLREDVEELDDRMRILSRSVQEAQVTQDARAKRLDALESRIGR